MNVKVKLQRTHEIKKINLDDGSTVEKLIKKMGFKPDSVLVLSNNTPIPIDDTLSNGQELTILQVSSGG